MRGDNILSLRQSVLDYVFGKYMVESDYPWQNDDKSAVLRHRDNKKWFALIMRLSPGRLGLECEGWIDVINLKSDPILIGDLRQRQGFLPAYHMNKDSWITVALDGSVGEEEIFSLIDLSYKLTKSKAKRAKK